MVTRSGGRAEVPRSQRIKNFHQEQIVSALRRQLSWTHFKRLSYLEDPLKRDFYAQMCRVESWPTRTLDAYVSMIDTAQSHIHTVNGFPLILEIQHALLRALRRGARVRTLFGNLTPTHDGIPFQGPWSTARTEAVILTSTPR